MGANGTAAGSRTTETLGIAGAGTIATGLAVAASSVTEVVLWARSEESARRVSTSVARLCEKLAELGADSERIEVVTELERLRGTSYRIEAISEDHDCKAELLARLGELEDGTLAPILATTTSSLSVSELATASRRADRFVGLHVFNPVPKMELVELVLGPAAGADVRERTVALCAALGKTPVEVPDTPGFVVNRLLFPYLFDAVRLLSESGLEPEAVDRCMTLGAGLPMGPLALLDFVGLDVSRAIGDSIGLEAPPALDRLVAEGSLGRKSGRGFYNYS